MQGSVKKQAQVGIIPEERRGVPCESPVVEKYIEAKRVKCLVMNADKG